MGGDVNNLELLYRGQWGFSFQVPAGFANPGGFQAELLSANQVEGVDRYTVVLNQMRYSGGLLLSTTQPANNQVDTRFALTMEWGAYGSGDTCEVDYPCRGGSFTVGAEYLRLRVFRDVTGPAIGPAPILSGYITPSQKLLGALTPPTRSLSVTLLASGTSLVPIPPRAVAYRLWVSGATAIVTSVLQMQGDGASLGMLDGVGVNGNFEDTLQENRAAFRPLNPTATFLLLTNGAVVTSTTYIQFMLDLG